jgi:hypothetical protein
MLPSKYCAGLTLVSGGQGGVAGLACVAQLGQLVAQDGEGGGLVEHALVDQHGRQLSSGTRL